MTTKVDDEILTLDEHENKHSYNDEPAESHSLYKTWYRHGKEHRENDLPSSIFDPETKHESMQWCINGERHRENDKPSFQGNYISRWYVCDVPHRLTGPATMYAKNGPLSNRSDEWNLYGLEITGEQHKQVLSHAELNSYPLWLSFLVFIEVLSEEDVALFASFFNDKETPLPATWVIAALGLNDRKLEEAYNNSKIPFIYVIADPDEISDTLENFLKVVRFETSI